MNESLTIASADLSLEQCDELLIAGVCNIRDAILGYTQHGLTQPQISERVEELGFKSSRSTIQRHVADLRKEGLLPAVGQAASTQRRHRQQERSKLQNEAMSTQPTAIPTNVQPTRSPVCPPFLSVVPELEPECEAGTEQFHSVPMGADDCRVISAEVVTMSDGERDFQRAEQLFAELFALSKRNFANGWTELQWNTLGGDCRTLAECCDARGKRQRSRPQRQVLTLGAN